MHRLLFHIPHTYTALYLFGINLFYYNFIYLIAFMKVGFSTEDLSHIVSFGKQTYVTFDI